MKLQEDLHDYWIRGGEVKCKDCKVKLEPHCDKNDTKDLEFFNPAIIAIDYLYCSNCGKKYITLEDLKK